MKEKIKNINFPTLLLLIISVFQLRSVYYGLLDVFRGNFDIFFLMWFIEVIAPIVLFFLLFFKEDKKKLIAILSIVFGSVTLINGLLAIRNLFAYDAFITAVVGGPLFEVVSGVLIGILLLNVGIKIVKDRMFTGKYYFLCGFSIFLVIYASVFMAIANPMAIIFKLPTFFYVLSLWYIPKLYAQTELEKNKVKVTAKKIRTIVIVVIAAYALLAFGYGLAGGGSSGSSYDYDKGYGYTKPYKGESASDYIKRQDPDLYNNIVDRYNSLR